MKERDDGAHMSNELHDCINKLIDLVISSSIKDTALEESAGVIEAVSCTPQINNQQAKL